MPPVASLGELTPTTQYVIFLAKKTITVQDAGAGRSLLRRLLTIR
jgi:hypothetical protein